MIGTKTPLDVAEINVVDGSVHLLVIREQLVTSRLE